MSSNTLSRRTVLELAAATGAAWAGLPARAEAPYPNRMIRIVVPVAPGFNTDALARIVAEELQKRVTVPVIVDNRAGGAGGSIGAESVARSDNDGYTLLFSSPGPLGVNKFLYKNLTYDPLAFTPVSLVSEAVNVLLVRADAGYKSLRDLIDQARANPGRLSYASGGAGTSTHLSSELLKVKTKTDILHIPYKGSAAAATGLMSGQVDFFIGELGNSVPHVKSGRLVALGVGSATRHELLPDVPPIGEVVPGFTSTVWYGLVAPPRTPAPIVDKLSAWVGEIMKQPAVAAKLQAAGGRAIGAPAGEFGKFIASDTAHWEQVIRDAKISPA